MKVALLGAESTGKSQLAYALAAHLCASGQRAIAIDEYLREWCDEHERTPQQLEQTHIANEQQARIESAAAVHDWVIADTTPLMTAVYSEFIFSDTSLHEAAFAYQRTFDLTLLTGLDMPWQPDGIQRDGERVRAPVDTLLRQSLQSAGITFEVIYGQGDERLSNALLALQRHNHPLQGTINSIAPCAYSMPATVPKTLKKWQWNCEKCSDPDCEHRLFSSLQSGEETTQTQKAQHNMPKSERTQVLFVCSRNQWRSPTAEQIWRKHPALSVRSGGTSPNARHPVSENDVTWADVIFVMEEKHKSRLIAQFRHLLDNTTIHVLDIPDDYKYMDVELVALLREAISSILELD